jgi:hypothetical protein
MHSARFTYRLNRLKPRASQFRGHPVNMYDILTLLLDFHTLTSKMSKEIKMGQYFKYNIARYEKYTKKMETE